LTKSSKRKKEREDLRLHVTAKILTAIDRLSGEIAFDEAYLFGSVTKPFRFLESSDIDIGFVGLDNRHFFKAISYLSKETGHDVDIVQMKNVKVRQGFFT
jgi:predicted nucleotidyltransferase